MMLKQFYPGRCAASAYGLPYGDFYSRGIRGVIFDIDNTLVPHGAPADDRARALFKELQEMGMNTCLMSNNKEPRVASFAGEVGSGYLFKAGKPRRRGYEEAMKQMGTARQATLFVGDQIFTDIYGANRAGIKSILVKPIDPKEEIQIVLKRIPERMVLWFYKRGRQKEREGNSNI